MSFLVFLPMSFRRSEPLLSRSPLQMALAVLWCAACGLGAAQAQQQKPAGAIGNDARSAPTPIDRGRVYVPAGGLRRDGAVYGAAMRGQQGVRDDDDVLDPANATGGRSAARMSLEERVRLRKHIEEAGRDVYSR